MMRFATGSEEWLIRVPKRETSYLRYLLEAYEGLAGISSSDGGPG